MVLDTNILIYAAKPGGENLRPWLEDPEAMISILTRIEALGFSEISSDEKDLLESVLKDLPESGLTEEIAIQAISLRQHLKMGLADAIIAATALVHNLPLVTRNVDDFKKITELRVINPFEIQP